MRGALLGRQQQGKRLATAFARASTAPARALCRHPCDPSVAPVTILRPGAGFAPALQGFSPLRAYQSRRYSAFSTQSISILPRMERYKSRQITRTIITIIYVLLLYHKLSSAPCPARRPPSRLLLRGFRLGFVPHNSAEQNQPAYEFAALSPWPRQSASSSSGSRSPHPSPRLTPAIFSGMILTYHFDRY